MKALIFFQILADSKAYSVHICYDEQRNLKAVVFACDGIMIDISRSLPARRLSTDSYANKQTNKGFYTQWRWYWKDDDNTWVLYEKVCMYYNM